MIMTGNSETSAQTWLVQYVKGGEPFIWVIQMMEEFKYDENVMLSQYFESCSLNLRILQIWACLSWPSATCDKDIGSCLLGPFKISTSKLWCNQRDNSSWIQHGISDLQKLFLFFSFYTISFFVSYDLCLKLDIFMTFE